MCNNTSNVFWKSYNKIMQIWKFMSVDLLKYASFY